VKTSFSALLILCFSVAAYDNSTISILRFVRAKIKKHINSKQETIFLFRRVLNNILLYLNY